MSMKEINIQPGAPIIIGLAGKAGSGKTSVAEYLVPKGSIETTLYGAKWDHIFYALPLYELSTIRRSIKGSNEVSRQKYAIHSTLFDIYGKSSIGFIPEYNDFINRVDMIQQLAIEPEGIKPRSFLQKAGDICRDSFEDCFARWGINKSNELYRSYLRSLSEDEIELPFIVLISDVRFENEAQKIIEQPNGFIICFDADQSVLDERILKRDGKLMTEEQKNHKSEQQIDSIKTLASAIIKSDSMNIEEQAKATLAALKIGNTVNA